MEGLTIHQPRAVSTRPDRKSGFFRCYFRLNILFSLQWLSVSCFDAQPSPSMFNDVKIPHQGKIDMSLACGDACPELNT